ncbi:MULTISPECIES: lipoprotein LpqH [Mycobacterium]|uniref:Lipoprotein n=1 Tax=Mycobacterium kiyosense TaxID=2871094 RepID=A0A9P3QDG5_9MYCO|nr:MULTISPECIES: lipoprotein LpqH [Mycobacterium]BDB45556.1 putative lipoprotein [Mycobacterium kiyosense]BDE11181.1 putative lipoprotein [Mycobacterium sp. 20KCMC460]GLB85515.1 putative lipoprotein [Mycobacterium kiyosense]GLB92174.1 putative lipoprotein [Mycobacterium kiyosense]GLB98446.1 putative lipoprotein [Mycobacterium kiyosense]
MNRVIAAAIGTLGCATVLVGCSSGGHTAGPASNGPASSISAGGGATEVKVGGTDLAGVNPSSVTCVKQGGKINIGSGATNGQQQALAVVMTDANPPTVDSLALVVDGNALSVADNMGSKVGSAKVAVEGKTYTITGQAQGADLRNPLAGMITKDFSIKVTCG